MDLIKIKSPKILKGVKIKQPLDKYPITVCVVGAFSVPHSNNILLADAFEKLDGVKEVIRYDYRKRLRTEGTKILFSIREAAHKSNLVIICKGSYLHKEFFEKAVHKCTVIYWMMDVFTHFKSLKGLLSNTTICDYRSATGYDTAHRMMEKTDLPVYQILDGADTSVYYPTNDKKIYDVTFIGTADKERIKIRDFLKNKGIQVNFIGPDFTSYIPPDDFRKICNQSKIVLNISRGNYVGYSSIRIWNLLACGSFVLTKRITEINKYLGLTIGKELSEYTNLDDLLHKVEWYLNHEDKRKEIAKNGLEFVKKNRTWKEVAESFMVLAYSEEGCSKFKRIDLK